MTAFEKGQQKQGGTSTQSSGASPSLDELVAAKGLRKAGGDAITDPQEKRGEEAKLSAQKSDHINVVRWLQLFAAVGIPLVLVYLAIAGLVNPQFAELRELVSDNRDAIISNRDLISSNREAIAANSSSIARLEDRIDSSVERLDAKIDSSIERLDAKIDLLAELMILAFTNENITEAELRNLLNAGED